MGIEVIEVMRNVEENTGKKYKCTHGTCSRSFSKSDHLKTHVRTHTGERPFRCDHAKCFKEFGDLANLKRHIRVHTGERPFRCPEKSCGKQFSVSSNLKQHLRVHTGERPYACQVCGRTFGHVSSRRKHMNTHEGTAFAVNGNNWSAVENFRKMCKQSRSCQRASPVKSTAPPSPASSNEGVMKSVTNQYEYNIDVTSPSQLYQYNEAASPLSASPLSALPLSASPLSALPLSAFSPFAVTSEGFSPPSPYLSVSSDDERSLSPEQGSFSPSLPSQTYSAGAFRKSTPPPSSIFSDYARPQGAFNPISIGTSLSSPPAYTETELAYTAALIAVSRFITVQKTINMGRFYRGNGPDEQC